LGHLNAHTAQNAPAGEEAGPPGAPAAVFSGLPSKRILTLNMDVPEAWLVEPVRAELDLDNLRLGDLGRGKALQVTFLSTEFLSPDGNPF
jgi:UDP-glucose:glycoprotein glucosyltransferase